MGKFLAILPLSLLLGACSLNVAEKHWKQAEDFSRQGQHLRAIEEYTKVVNFGQRTPVAIRAQLEIARIYEQFVRNYPMAIRAYRDVYRRSEDLGVKIDARAAVARVYSDLMQNPAAAIEEYDALFKEGAAQEKDAPDWWLAWAKALSESGRFEEAAGRYREFRTKFPGHKEGPRSLFEEGQSHLADRRPEKAIDVFREIISKFSGQPDYTSLVAESYYGLGNALESSDQLDAALEAYRQGLATYPNRKVVELKIERVEKRKKERKY
jgi:tetratricopeptide (TPR) repeat protein